MANVCIQQYSIFKRFFYNSSAHQLSAGKVPATPQNTTKLHGDTNSILIINSTNFCGQILCASDATGDHLIPKFTTNQDALQSYQINSTTKPYFKILNIFLNLWVKTSIKYVYTLRGIFSKKILCCVRRVKM